MFKESMHESKEAKHKHLTNPHMNDKCQRGRDVKVHQFGWQRLYQGEEMRDEASCRISTGEDMEILQVTFLLATISQ